LNGFCPNSSKAEYGWVKEDAEKPFFSRLILISDAMSQSSLTISINLFINKRPSLSIQG
jgi:hypothetical protein